MTCKIQVQTECYINRYSAIFTFFSIFFLYFPLIFFGLDMTDQGFHLTNQDLANSIHLDYIKINPFWWFSDIIGGLWISLTEPLGLLGARLGFVLLYASMGAITIKIISLAFKINRVSIFAIIVMSTLAKNGTMLIDYDSFPSFLVILLCFFYLKSYLYQDQKKYAVFTGIIFTLLIFSRMPAISVISIPLFALILCVFLQKDKVLSFIKLHNIMILSSLSCFSLFFVYLIYNGSIQEFFKFSLPTDIHTPYYLLSTLPQL